MLTNNLGVTVAGTTSMAGLGVASFRFGTQADNAIELEVVTGAGDIVVCSRDREPELFDMVRCSLGQIGMITRVRTRLRRCAPMVRMYTLVYDELGRFMDDALKVMHAARRSLRLHGRHLLAGAARLPEDRRRRRARQGDDRLRAVALPDVPDHRVRARRGAGRRAGAGPAFALAPLPDSGRDAARVLPPHGADVRGLEALGLLGEAAPVDGDDAALGAGARSTSRRSSRTCRRARSAPAATSCSGRRKTSTSSVPLFMHPGGEQVLGWGVLGAVPESKLDEMLTQLDMASELSIAYGGKRYLSGFITFDTPERWAAHYGDQWPRLCAAKRRWDPDGILAPGFIQYE